MPSAALSPNPLFPHGGARRKPGEQSDTLNLRQCEALIDAAVRAAEAGKPFNRFITLLWEKSGVAGADATAATRQFIKRASDWSRHYDERLCWAYVHEWGKRNGAHAHILLHVPKHLVREFRVMPLRWTKAILPAAYVASTTKSKPVMGGDAPDNVSWDYYGISLGARVHYMLKAAPPRLADELGIAHWGSSPWGQTSRVCGKRTGVWRNRSIDSRG